MSEQSDQPPKPNLPTAVDKSKKKLRKSAPANQPPKAQAPGRKNRLEINVNIGKKADTPVKRLPVPELDEPVAILSKSHWDGDAISAKALNANSRTESAPSEDEDVSTGPKKKRTSLILLFSTTVILVVLTVGVFLWREQLSDSFRPMDPMHLELESSDTDDHSEFSWMVKHAGEIVQESTRVLENYAKATTYEQALTYVRDPEKVRSKMARYWKHWPSEKILSDETPEGGIETHQNHPNVLIKGRDGLQNAFNYRFVRENGKMVLDWEACTGIGDMSLEDALQAPIGQEMILHLSLESSPFYPLDHPEESYRSYKVDCLDPEVYTWAFAPKDSPAAKTLAELMGDDFEILEKTGKADVTLKVSCLPGVGRKWFLIRDVMYEGWVRP